MKASNEHAVIRSRAVSPLLLCGFRISFCSSGWGSQERTTSRRAEVQSNGAREEVLCHAEAISRLYFFWRRKSIDPLRVLMRRIVRGRSVNPAVFAAIRRLSRGIAVPNRGDQVVSSRRIGRCAFSAGILRMRPRVPLVRTCCAVDRRAREQGPRGAMPARRRGRSRRHMVSSAFVVLLQGRAAGTLFGDDLPALFIDSARRITVRDETDDRDGRCARGSDELANLSGAWSIVNVIDATMASDLVQPAIVRVPRSPRWPPWRCAGHAYAGGGTVADLTIPASGWLAVPRIRASCRP